MKKTLHLLRMAHGLMLMAVMAVLLSVAPTAAQADPVAYARLAGNTLTFYYDENKGQSTDESAVDYSLNANAETPGWYDNNIQVTRVVFDQSFKDYRPTTCYNWFSGMENLTTIENPSNLKTDLVTNTSGMFMGCSSLTSLSLADCNTSNVENMSAMFYGCEALSTLDISSFDTRNVTTMGNMFLGCYKLTTLDLTSFNTAKVTNMQNMFFGDNLLTTITVTNGFTTAAVTKSNDMFGDCTALKGAISYDKDKTDATYANYQTGYLTQWVGPYVRYADETLTFYYGSDKQTGDYSLNTGSETPGWNTVAEDITKVVFDESFKKYKPTTCRKWFHNASALTTIEGIENLNTSAVTNMGGMFYGCEQLTAIDLSHFNTAMVTDMHSMFYDCSGLTQLDVSGFDVSHVVDMSQMFANCCVLAELKTGGFKTSSVEKLYNIFDECNELKELDLSGLNTANVENMTSLFSGCESLATLDISAFNTAKATDMSAMFYNCHELTSIDLKNFDTSLVTDMSNMFYGCYALTSLNVSNFTTAAVTDMAWMFAGCQSLKSLDLYSFETTQVTDMNSMFYECTSLKSLDVSNFDTDNVENMCAMFRYCSLLTKLDLSHFNTSKVKDMSWMFDECNALTSLDLTYFNTANVTNMEGMFYNCYALSSLDLSSFSTAQVTNMSQMFKNNSALAAIYVSKNFSTASVTNSDVMFSGCTSLKGAIAYDPEYVDGTYANYQTGYLTQWVGPYVRYADETLTFYYGSDKQTGDFSIVQRDDTPDWVERDAIRPTKAVFDESFSQARPTTTATWFYNFPELTYIQGMQYLNTSEVTDMLGMFCGCAGLTTIDLLHFNTAKVVDMSSMFAGCNNLTKIDLTQFNTSKVTNFCDMFYECESLKSIDVSDFNTAQAVNIAGMFEKCSALTSLNLSNFDTSNAQEMESMFYECKVLTTLDLSSFNTAAVTRLNSMFDGCTALKTIYVSDDFTTDNVSQSNNMFKGCTALKGAVVYDASNLDAGYANYTTGYFTKKVGTNGADILGATGSPLTIESLVIDDAKAYKLNKGEECQAGTAEYSRPMTSTWGTLCLPFAIDAAAEGNTCNFYSVKNVTTDCVTLTQMENVTIEAGCPVVISKKTASQTSVSVVATNTTVVAEPVVAYADNAEDAIAGTFVSVMLKGDCYYFIAKDKFYRVADYSSQGVKVNPFRAFILASIEGNRAAALNIVDNGSTTGIDTTDTIDMLNNATTEYYDMSGRRIEGLQKGVNIVKTGNKTRKVIVK